MKNVECRVQGARRRLATPCVRVSACVFWLSSVVFGVWCLEFRVEGLGTSAMSDALRSCCAFRVLGCVFRVSCFVFRLACFGLRVSGSGFGVWGLGFGMQGLGFSVWGLGFGV